MFGKLWYILTLRCEEADRLRSQQALEPLTRVERVAMSAHQLVCKSCRIAANQIRILDEAIAHLRDESSATPAVDAGLPADARDRLARTLRDAENSQKKNE
ncbi:MAG: hypothetical protein H6819_07245 [Phycisphaerales bacterium]|nr:hypothetical protein [Phycisphaerales bacterium]MCB9857710.1 hypothetical protein [Phycisphaerales bacterium]